MENRISKIKAVMKKKQLDGIIVLSDLNRRYLSGFKGTSGALLITHDQNLLITDFRYIEQATKQAPQFKIIQHTKPLYEELLYQIDKANISHVGFESHLVSYDTFLTLDKGKHDLISLDDEIELIRMVKDESEIKAIDKAAQIVDEAYQYILKIVEPGMTEIDVKAHLESKMLHLGSEKTSFDTIVASGYRGALPHGLASNKVIERGDMVTLDFGAYYDGYASDITRTFAVGEPSAQMKEIYEIVLESQMTAVNQIRPGLTGKEVDSIARNIIEAAGYGKHFGHSLGHGVGLNVHEYPNVSPKSDTVLEPNHVVTIEPGIYVEGLGGVRIEDDILITENGSRRFTNCTKDLIIL
ncbi:M24 family metallopeptidase [Staphylococcus agnetis]|uniref:M24 family metallopeptidase n=1 Tax=Staphylococcus agnetis TaxID=985762 RepID=UPI000D199E27|nr:aminopeptidase P family protein [Staphylococcus agnetis]NJH87118.1 M24 family metallopeptidase [Staphylococcus agnetis]NJI16421.1 M24 family metallopeptidase [Staphylococcus agnetis]PTH39721.1 peptidase M24 family protein [Staphylococcus agnetis]